MCSEVVARIGCTPAAAAWQVENSRATWAAGVQLQPPRASVSGCSDRVVRLTLRRPRAFGPRAFQCSRTLQSTVISVVSRH